MNLKIGYKAISDFSSENIEKEFKSVLEEKELGMGKLLPAFRVSLTGLGMGPSLFDIASFLGKEETIKRIETNRKNKLMGLITVEGIEHFCLSWTFA